jgi:hypothetical protein
LCKDEDITDNKREGWTSTDVENDWYSNKVDSVSKRKFKGSVLCENLVVQQYGLLYSNNEKKISSYSEQSIISATFISRFAIRLCPAPSSTPVLITYFTKMDFNIIIPFFS